MSADQGQLYDFLLFFVQAVAVLKRNQLDKFKRNSGDWTCANDEFDTRQANVIGSFPLYLKHSRGQFFLTIP